MKLIIDKTYGHFAKNVMAEFEETIQRLSRLATRETTNEFINTNILRFLRRFPYKGRMVPKGKEDYFVVVMGIWVLWKAFPYFLYARKRHIYLFDAWFESHLVIERLINILGIDTVFFSSLTAKKIFEKTNRNCTCLWIPEGLVPEEYSPYPYEEKNIDVLNFGRKWDWYHEKVVASLAQNNKSYLYEKKWFEVIFESHDDFKDGLARSKISICFPKDISHPEIAAGISTMTNRYLQSMASKCLIVGLLPDEMKILFDYNPVIEIDKENPAEQLLEILDNYESYIPLIEKNYATVCSEHTWEKRWRDIAGYLNVPVYD